MPVVPIRPGCSRSGSAMPRCRTHRRQERRSPRAQGAGATRVSAAACDSSSYTLPQMGSALIGTACIQRRRQRGARLSDNMRDAASDCQETLVHGGRRPSGQPPDDDPLLSCRAWRPTRSARPVRAARPVRGDHGGMARAGPVSRGLGAPEAARRAPRRRRDRRSAAAPRASGRPDARAPRRRGPRPGRRRRARNDAASRSSGSSAAARSRTTARASSSPTRSSGWRDRGLLLRPLVRALEAAMAAACAAFGVTAGRREGHPGAWCDPGRPEPRKIGALGIRVERGVSYHGIALNVAPDLADFDLIDPCGMPGLVSTSIAAELRRAGADDAPATRPGRGRPRRRGLRPATSPAGSVRRWPGSRRDPWPRRPDAMAAGLFELRKDPITGWWVATVVDRAFHLRPLRAGRAAGRRPAATARTAACRPGQGIRTRMLKDFAFHVVGTDEESREIDGAMAQVALYAGARERQLANDRRAAGRAPAAPRRRQRDHRGARVRRPGPRSRARATPARPTTSSSSRTGAPRPAPGRTTSASTSTTCPRSRTGSPRSWAGRRAS